MYPFLSSSIPFPAISSVLTQIFPLRSTGSVSLKLSWTYFDRVFSTWLAYAGIILLLIVPLPLQAMNWVESGAAPFIGIYGIVAGLVLLLLVFPALTIGLNRVYMILSSEEVTEEVTEDDEVEDIDVSLIGGV